MRTFAVTLTANTNSVEAGPSLSLSSSLVEIGAWSREVEKELTKVSPSEQTLKINDADGSVWAWIQAQLAVNGATEALYPPWLTIDIDGLRWFTGVVYPRQIQRNRRTGAISITAEDWSSTFKSRYLGAKVAEDDLNPLRNPWLRPYPRVVQNRPSVTQFCWIWYYATNPSGYDYVIWEGPQQFVEVGDYVTLDIHAQYPQFPVGKQYKCYAVGQDQLANGSYATDRWWARFEGLGQDVWDYIHHDTMDSPSGIFTRVPQTTDLRAYYVVTKSVASDASDVHVIDLDTVDGLVAGDVLTTIGTASKQTWTLLQVDAQALQVVTKETVQGIVAQTTHLFFSDDTLADLVLDDARLAIRRALTLGNDGGIPYSVDFSRFVPPTVANPVLVWLPLRPMGSQDLSTVRDLDQGIADVRVYGAGTAAWNGTPEMGWVATASASPQAPWASQRLVAPASSMPNESATLAPSAPPSNAVLAMGIRDLVGYSPSTLSVPAVNLLYDYLQMRRLLIRKDRSVQINAWSGSAWGGDVAATWPGANPVLSASVFPGEPGSVLGLTVAGLQLVALPSGAGSNVVATPAAAADAVLRTTPWGTYLVGAKGYGLVTYAAGVLSLSWVTLTSAVTSFFPTTFQGLNPNELMVLTRFDTTPTTTGEVTTETHLLRLAAIPPADASAAVLATEKLMDGAPRLAGALRDATQPERIIGHCGGRLFVYGRTLPAAYAIERYTPSGLKALELVEHICQVLNAVAVPDPLGCLHIISRGLLEAPYDLAVDRVQLNETTTWEHFYSVVRVSSAKDDSILADAWGIPGGDVLEYSQHPFLWMQSGCSAVAESLASWFAIPRGYREETWFWSDPNTAAPWEFLPPLATIRLNGEASKWLLMSLEDDKVNGQATVKLVEVF